MPRYYLATMQVWDEECRARIEKHRRQRAGRGFVTVERPLDLAGMKSITLDKGGTILLEDLGNLAANEFYAPGRTLHQTEEIILAGIRKLYGMCCHLVIVSNEVGTGGSNYAGETEQYLRLLGKLHQELAGQADAVCEVLPVCQVITKEGTLYDPGGNHRGRLCHVQRNPGAAACLERKKHAVCDVCVSDGRSGLCSGVFPLDSFMRRLAGPGLAAGGRVLPDSRVHHGRHSSGRVCGYLRRAGQLCGTGKKSRKFSKTPIAVPLP